MNKRQICVEKLQKAYISNPTLADPDSRAMALQANVMGLGYIMDENLVRAVSGLDTRDLDVFAQTLIDTLKDLKGDNVKHTPMYPNFPQQVMEASDLELFLNAIVHYWSFGEWRPVYAENDREFAFESVKFQEIGLASKDEFDSIFTMIVGSNESISGRDKEIVQWFLDNEGTLKFPDVIPFKENMCIIGAYMVKNGINISGLVKNATDVLRIATHLSDGDISLADNTKFKSLKRSQRRNIVGALDKVATLEDLARHGGKWTKLAHSLHVGEYSDRLHGMMKRIRENQKIRTFNSDVEMHLANNHPVKATKLLITRPGDFARRLDHLLRVSAKAANQKIIADNFIKVADQVSTRVLLQLLGHFANRDLVQDNRVVFPKGSIQKAELIDAHSPLPETVVNRLCDGIRATLEARFAAEGDMLGNVYVDPALMDCPIPTQQRSAGKGTFDLARGTMLPIAGDKNTLRFFIYWVGRDIDLSVVFYDENFKTTHSVSYMNLRSSGLGTYHSGDITSAPRGASEFIDVDMEKALSTGVRYVAMSVLVFTGPTFSEHETCFAGWMTRSKPKSNEIYDPKTVEYKLNLNSESKNCIPVIFDLQERKAIWTDLAHGSSGYGYYAPNNVSTNRANMEDTVKAMTTNGNKVSLYDLFTMHAHARGDVVYDREDADFVFSWDGDVTPRDVNEINSRFVV